MSVISLIYYLLKESMTKFKLGCDFSIVPQHSTIAFKVGTAKSYNRFFYHDYSHRTLFKT